MTSRAKFTFNTKLHELKRMIKDQEKKYKSATNEDLADDLYVTLDYLRQRYHKIRTAEMS